MAAILASGPNVICLCHLSMSPACSHLFMSPDDHPVALTHRTHGDRSPDSPALWELVPTEQVFF